MGMWGLFVEVGYKLDASCPVFLAYSLHDVFIKLLQPFPIGHDDLLCFRSECDNSRISDIVVLGQQPFSFQPAFAAFENVLPMLVKIFQVLIARNMCQLAVDDDDVFTRTVFVDVLRNILVVPPVVLKLVVVFVRFQPGQPYRYSLRHSRFPLPINFVNNR